MWRDIDGRPLPEAGEAFLVPIGGGVYSFCWIVGFAEKGQMWHKRRKVSVEVDYFYVASASWFGHAPPTAEDLARPTMLQPTYPGRVHKLVVAKEATQPPKKFRPLGKVGRSAAGKLPSSLHFGGWFAVENAPREEWRYQQDPKGAVAKKQAAERKRLERNAAEARKCLTGKVRQKAAASVAELAREERLLSELPGMMSKRHARELTELVRKCARALVALGTGAAPKSKRAVLHALVADINEWHKLAGPGVIETAESEVLSAAIDRLGHAAGLRGHDFAEKLRDW